MPVSSWEMHGLSGGVGANFEEFISTSWNSGTWSNNLTLTENLLIILTSVVGSSMPSCGLDDHAVLNDHVVVEVTYW